jgi:hypothetical protein
MKMQQSKFENNLTLYASKRIIFIIDSSVYPKQQDSSAPPPPYGEYEAPPMPQQPQTVYVQQPAPTVYISQPPNFEFLPTQPVYHENPKQITCPNCHANVVTRLNYVTGGLTWVICAAICFFG